MIGILLLSSIIPIAFAATPPTIPGNETYMTVDGVLDTDSYILYPYEEESLNIGFSKYGEMINPDAGVGLEYKGIDVFANPNVVPMSKWSSGWIMDIHYIQQGHLRNVWAYALFSDLDLSAGPAAFDEGWKVLQQTKDADTSIPGEQHGGQRTNGIAETDPIRLIYDGPRRSIYLLRTVISTPEDEALIELTIQLVFNKVKKYVMEIKDIKRVADDKFEGPFQIEFSQRGQWDLGDEANSLSYAEFYNGLETKYNKHPFYTVDTELPEGQEHEVTYDLVQIIADDEDLVGFAAFWPQLISKWVTNIDSGITRIGRDKEPNYLTTMETKELVVDILELPDLKKEEDNYYYIWTDAAPTGPDSLEIRFPDDTLVEYPRGLGEWSDQPWVFKWDEIAADWMVLYSPTDWIWDDGPNKVYFPFGHWEPGDSFKLVYKRTMMGHIEHEPVPLSCMDGLFEDDEVGLSFGMFDEPKVPYVFAEWDFDLDVYDPDKASGHFRCMSLYGITDNNDAVDPDMNTDNEFKIDKEVIYQLNEVFNPWDLKDAAHKDTFRWAQKGDSDPITLKAHLMDKYGNLRDCLEGKHVLCKPEKWGEYCEDSEKVLIWDSQGERLLKRDTEYTFDPETGVIDIFVPFYEYKVLYSTILLPPPMTWDETDFGLRTINTTTYGIDLTREFTRDYVVWTFDYDPATIPVHSMTAVDIIFKRCDGSVVQIGFAPGETGGDIPIMKIWDGSWSGIMELPDDIIVTPGTLNEEHYEIMIPYKYFLDRKCLRWAAYVQADFDEPYGGSQQMVFPYGWGKAPHEDPWSNPLHNLYNDGVCWHNGRWEWLVIGEPSLASDSSGSAMLTATWADWKNKETWLSALDTQSLDWGPTIPYVLRPMDGDFRDDLGRAHLKDDWCTPDNWNGEEIYPYAISSSNILVVGGPIVNLAAEYFNDFTDAFVYSQYGDGFYAPGCWARTTQPYWSEDVFNDVTPDELWYDSVDIHDDIGYAIISTYKDLNETIGFIVYGYTAEDTYYTCYALRGGGLPWLQEIQPGVTTVLVEMDYKDPDLHPVRFHVKEFLGPFTECTGAYTSFKDGIYHDMILCGTENIEFEAECLGLCYKLVDIDFCGQVHPDP
ncbi:MAG: hypothetical protein NWE89_09030 [Candidatus Bathyarchaeota archaeon]|nr:hypothetical protein [Candidatus Bathyarchaeota archaeon]